MTANTASAANAPMTHRDFYASISAEQRVETALEMAREISEEQERHYAIATSLVSQLKLGVSNDSVDILALRLAEVLEEMLIEQGQPNRLIDCLEVMKDLPQSAD